MNCKDLTISDYVKHDGIIKIVDAVYLYSVTVHDPSEPWGVAKSELVSVDDIEAVPLSGDFFVKNGFREQGDGCEWSYYNEQDGRGQYMILWNKNYNYLEIASYTETYGEFFRSGIRFLHELQQAMRLCGIEKKLTI